jgi:hypothetical protein
MLFNTSLQICQKGCLSCNSDNQCMGCDISKGFFWSGYDCWQRTEKGCFLVGPSGECHQCLVNHYLDSNARKCLPVSEANSKINCLQFDSNQNCKICISSYYLKDNACVKVTKTVDNCVYYSADGECKSCEKGYLHLKKTKKCVKVSSEANCLFHSFYKCRKCSNSYFLNQNLYFGFFANPRSLMEISGFLIEGIYEKMGHVSLPVCHSGENGNCLTYADPITCASCNEGWVISDKICVPVSPVPIPNCLSYFDDYTCRECKSGYFLNNNSCEAVVSIEKCTSYAKAALTTTCVACSDGLYPDGSSCKTRVASPKIQHCKAFNPSEDNCGECEPGFLLSSGKDRCYLRIENCQEYGEEYEVRVDCNLCKDGYYLNTYQSGNGNNPVLCQKCSFTYCKFCGFDGCMVCEDSYHVLNGLCAKRSLPKNCLKPHENFDGGCSICADGYFNFYLTNYCKSTAVIPNCIDYNDDGTCDECAEGTYLDGSVCKLANALMEKCIYYSLRWGCQACEVGYALFKGQVPSKCIVPPDYMTKTCTVNSETQHTSWLEENEGAKNVRCTVCSAKTIPYQVRGAEAICIKNSELYLTHEFNSVANCLRYGFDFNSILIACVECQPGYYLKIEKNYQEEYENSRTSFSTCIPKSACHTDYGQQTLILDDLMGFVNLCSLHTSHHELDNDSMCKVYSRKSVHTEYNQDYACLKPSADFVYFYNFVSNKIRFEENEVPISAVKSSSVDFSQGLTDLDAENEKPWASVFNWRGFDDFMQISEKPTSQTYDYSKCEVLFRLSESALKGSAFATVTGYTKITAGTDSCLRCEYGYQIKFKTTDATGNSVIPACVSMGTACQSSSLRAGGLPTYLNAMVSCFSCAAISSSPSFPTIVMEYNAVSGNANEGNLLQYSLPAVDASTKTASPIQGFSCRLPPAKVTNSAADNIPETNAVSNCGLFGVLSPVTAPETAPATTYNYCLACSTGYYPIYHGASEGGLVSGVLKHPAYMVRSCEKSNKCHSSPPSSPYNSCGKCIESEVVSSKTVYYAFSDFRAINCLPSSTANCFILDSDDELSSSTANPCLVCNHGHYLNKDGLCEKISPPNLPSGDYFAQSYFRNRYSQLLSEEVGIDDPQMKVILRIHYLLSFSGMQYGAKKCPTDYTLSVPPLKSTDGQLRVNELCFASSYLSSGALIDTTKYVKKCLQYSAEPGQELHCEVCETGHIPTSDRRTCVTEIPNCKYATETDERTFCQVCAKGYFNVDGSCDSKIENCEIHYNSEENSSHTYLECSRCMPGYYIALDGRQCFKGSVPNCSRYQSGSPIWCEQPMEGYFMPYSNNGPPFVFKIPIEDNCARYSNSNEYSRRLQSNSIHPNANSRRLEQYPDHSSLAFCSECKVTKDFASILGYNFGEEMYGKSKTDPTVCVPVPTVDNCQKYEINYLHYADSTFRCQECKPGYYLHENKCVARKVTSPDCEVYSSDSDYCTVCKNGMYLNYQSTKCQSSPTGVLNCGLYSSLTTCVRCLGNYFLSNNKCETSTAISNCDLYKGNNVCERCSEGYFLESATKCVVATANFCSTYKSVSACNTCLPGYKLETGDSSNDCVKIEIANCALLDLSASPVVCEICEDKFYLDSTKVCTAADSITNCVIYKSKTTCSLCKKGLILSLDSASCIQPNDLVDSNNNDPENSDQSEMVDQNCEDLVQVDPPICVACELGYFFKDGKCTSCSTITSIPNCLVCNPENPNVCVSCASGYYMNSKNQCLDPATIVDPNPNPNPNPNPTPTPSKISIPKLLNTLAVSLLLLISLKL